MELLVWSVLLVRQWGYNNILATGEFINGAVGLVNIVGETRGYNNILATGEFINGAVGLVSIVGETMRL